MVAKTVLPRGLDGPLRVDILMVVARPRRLLRKKDPDGLLWCTSKPDADNVRKAVLDALKAFWRDDSHVVAGETVKVYAERAGRARVVVRVSSDLPAPGLHAFSLGLLRR